MIKKLFFILPFLGSVTVFGFDSFFLQSVQIEGLQRVTKKAVLLQIPFRPGEQVTPTAVRHAIHNLFNTGYFETVQLHKVQRGILIKVKERPTIASIRYSNYRKFTKTWLDAQLNSIGIREGETLEPYHLSSLEKILADHYQSKGMYGAHVKVVSKPLARDRVALAIDFSEGHTAKIKQINFIGNHAFTTRQLLHNFSFSHFSLMAAFSPYPRHRLYADLENLRRFYLDHGYVRYTDESTQFNLTPDKKDVYVTVNINEGRPYKLLGVSVTGNLSSYEQPLHDLVHSFSNHTYNSTEMILLKEKIKALLGRHGYAYPKIGLHPEINDAEQTVKLHLHIDIGRRFYVRRLYFEGNKITKDEVLRREIRQMEGAVLNKELINKGKLFLDRLGYFAQTAVEIIPLQDMPDQVDVVYRIQEHNMGMIHAGLTYGAGTGIFGGNICFSQKNILGSGKTFTIEAEKNKALTQFSLSVFEPYLTIDGVRLKSSISYRGFKSDRANLSNYIEKKFRLHNELAIPINDHNWLYAGIGYKHSKFSDVQAQIACERYLSSIGQGSNQERKLQFTVNDFPFNGGWRFNSFDRGYFPTSGSEFDIGGAITKFASTNAFYKLSFSGARYWPLNQEHHWIIKGQINLNYADGIGGKGLPFYEHFCSNMVRGFAFNSLGPRAVYRKPEGTYEISTEGIGGNALAAVRVALIFPPPFLQEKYRNIVRTSYFLDAGNEWDTHWDKCTLQGKCVTGGNSKIPDYGNFRQFRVSTGVAVEWLSPMGLITLSCAIPIKKYDGDKQDMLQFSIGTAF